MKSLYECGSESNTCLSHIDKTKNFFWWFTQFTRLWCHCISSQNIKIWDSTHSFNHSLNMYKTSTVYYWQSLYEHRMQRWLSCESCSQVACGLAGEIGYVRNNTNVLKSKRYKIEVECQALGNRLLLLGRIWLLKGLASRGNIRNQGTAL